MDDLDINLRESLPQVIHLKRLARYYDISFFRSTLKHNRLVFYDPHDTTKTYGINLGTAYYWGSSHSEPIYTKEQAHSFFEWLSNQSYTSHEWHSMDHG